MSNAQSARNGKVRKTSSSTGASTRPRKHNILVKSTTAGKRYVEICEILPDGSSSEQHVAILQEDLLPFSKAFMRQAAELEPRLQRFNVEELRVHYPNAFKTWSPAEDELLAAEYGDGAEIIDLAKLLRRRPGAIAARVKLLQLVRGQNSTKQSDLIRSQRPLSRPLRS